MKLLSIVPDHMRNFFLGFTLLLISGVLCQEYAPQIIEHPQSVIVIRNKPTTLMCRADGNPTPTYRWYKDGRPLRPSSHYTVLPSGALFLLRVAQGRSAQDTGVYVCEATNYLGSEISQNATLEVAYMRDDFRKVSDDLTASSGDQLELECTPPRANPTPNVTWEKDGQPVVPSGRRRQQDGNLQFTQVRAVDEGEYVCIATNMAETKRSRAVVLLVSEGPDFLIVPEDTVATVGETVKLECQADGQPLPAISWSRLESPMATGRVAVLEDNSLRIRDATIADSGTYVCTAQSQVGKKSKQAIIKIVASIDFLTEPVDVTVNENGVTSFQCVANGNPKPTVFWQKDGVGDLFMFPGQNYNRYSVLEDGTLTIVRVQTSDEGRYVCSAVGQSTVSTSAYLTVEAVIDSYPPVIDIGVVNQTLTVGENAMLPCQVISTDQTNILWLKNNAPISRNDRITQLDSGTLQISALHSTDSALYTCVATRSSYQTKWNATLLVIGADEIEKIGIRKMPPEKDLPSSPRQLIVNNITGSSALLSWQQPVNSGGSVISHYRLDYFIDEGLQAGWMVLLDRIPASPVHVYNLRHLTSYRFIVRAANVQGFGKPSEVSQPIATLDSHVTPQPRVTLPISPQMKLNMAGVSIVEVQVLSSTAVKLIWQVERYQEYIEGFYISYRKVGVLEQQVVETVRDVSMLLITELTPATHFTFTIKPFHQQEIGLETPPFTVSTLKHGDELPREIGGDDVLQEKLNQCEIRLRTVEPVSTTSFKVLWRLQNDVCKDYIDGYHIKYYKDNNKNPYYLKTVKKSRMATIHNLDPDSTYHVSVLPFNGKQLGKGSDVKEVTFISTVNENTPGSLDGLPIGVRVHVKSSETISVEWKPPVITHDVIVDYLVMCLGNNSMYHRNITTKNNLTFYVTFTDLEPGMTYTILVAARMRDRSAATRNMVRIGPPSTVTIQLNQDPVILNNKSDESLVTSPLFIGILGGVISILAIVILTFWFLKQKRKKKQGMNSKVVFTSCDGDGNCSIYKPAVSQVSSKGQEGQWNSHSWQRTQVDNQEYTVNTYGFHSNCDHPVPHDCSASNTWSSAGHSTLETFHRRMQKPALGPEYAVVEKSESPNCSLHGIHVLMPSNSKEDPLNIEPYASTSLIQARYLHQQQQAQRLSENSLNRSGPKAPWHGEVINNGYSSSDGSGALPPAPPPPPDRCIVDRMQHVPGGFPKPIENNSCTPYQMRASSPCNTCQKPARPAVHITTNPLASRNITFHGGVPHLPYTPAATTTDHSPTPPNRQWALSSADSCSDNNPSPPCDQLKDRFQMSGSPDPYKSQLNDLSSLQSYQVSPMQQSLPLHKYLTQQQQQQLLLEQEEQQMLQQQQQNHPQQQQQHPHPQQYQHQQHHQRPQEQQPTYPPPDHECEDIDFEKVNPELDSISMCTDSIVTSCTSGSSSMHHSRESLDSDGSYFSDVPNITSIPQILNDRSPSISKTSSSIT
ncbi:roundabout homolog 2-like isoform X2 [Antedon mediterranea]|uniref:roundabout homolog 2-like isoform X2 n=1 Tax=Antedon mediterranea TaxID=105859 RepID=UPI003AF8D53D